MILSEAISYGVGIIGQDEIDEINILNATKKGLTISLQELTQKPDLIIVDALNNIDTLGTKYESIIKGDARTNKPRIYTSARYPVSFVLITALNLFHFYIKAIIKHFI